MSQKHLNHGGTPLLVPVAVLLMLSAIALAAQAPKTAPARPPAAAAPGSMRAVATTRQLMHMVTIPSSDAVFKAAGDSPKTDEKWNEVRDSALAVAESGNLLMIGSRVVDRT